MGAIVSRLQLDHPALGEAGGSTLHAEIQAIYKKIGDNISTRILTALALANSATATVEHDFKVAFGQLRYDLYIAANSDPYDLTRITATSSPSLSQFTIIANVTNPTTQIDITNNSGSTRNLVLVAICDPLNLSEGDIQDIDIVTTAPQDGQALVYDSASSKFKPGASGDSSFKLQTVATPNLSLKGGYILLDDERELATYSGSGSVAASFGVDLTMSLTTIFGSAPANATTYYLYLDLLTLATTPTTLTDTGRKLYPITISNFVLSTTTPESRDPSRYVPIGLARSATTGTVWSGSGAAFATLGTRRHESLTRFFAYPETYTTAITSATATNTLSHNLSGKPQSVFLAYYDGTNEIGLNPETYLKSVTATQILVSSLGLTFGGGQELRVYAVRIPVQPNLASASRQFVSAWQTGTGTTTFPHGLNDIEDIKGAVVEEWDVSAGRWRFVDPSSLIVNFDATNFYANWTGLSPSATLQYRIIAGGSPNPSAIPLTYGGYTKFVGFGSGSYATVTAALAAASAGDSILINRDTDETADLSVPAGVRIDQMPNTTVRLAGSLTNGVRFVGAKGAWKNMNVKLSPTGTEARGVSVEAADCWVDGWVELATAQTLTAAVLITSGGVRAKVSVGVLKTLGTITALEDNQDGAGSTSIWGG